MNFKSQHREPLADTIRFMQEQQEKMQKQQPLPRLQKHSLKMHASIGNNTQRAIKKSKGLL